MYEFCDHIFFVLDPECECEYECEYDLWSIVRPVSCNTPAPRPCHGVVTLQA